MNRALSLLLVLVAASGWAEVKIANPGLADHETLTYIETIGKNSHPYAVTLTLTGEGSLSRYEYRSVGPDLVSVYRLDPVTLISLSSETLTRAADATVKRTATYEDLKPKAESSDLVITDMGSLPVVLRGFPWGQVNAAKLIYLGNLNFGGGGFSVELRVTGQETVTAAGRSWVCWHATTGLGGALSLVMAKTDWWFAAEGTHPLVKTSGPIGGPGSPVRTLVLQSDQVTADSGSTTRPPR